MSGKWEYLGKSLMESKRERDNSRNRYQSIIRKIDKAKGMARELRKR